MIIWTIANQKGGVGKTTTTVTLGGLLAKQGRKVILVDTDPHASLSYYFGIDSEELSSSIYDVFISGKNLDKDRVLDSLCPTKLDSLFILPATMALATLDRTLGSQEGMGLILRRALHSVADEFDVALIDCPPVLGVLMVNALAACSQIIVPCQTEFLALKGLERMIHTLLIMGKSQKKTFDYTVVPTMYDKRINAAIDALDTLKENYAEHVWDGVIPVDTRFRDASQAQTPPAVYCPRSRGVYAYTKLLNYLEMKETS